MTSSYDHFDKAKKAVSSLTISESSPYGYLSESSYSGQDNKKLGLNISLVLKMLEDIAAIAEINKDSFESVSRKIDTSFEIMNQEVKTLRKEIDNVKAKIDILYLNINSSLKQQTNDILKGEINPSFVPSINLTDSQIAKLSKDFAKTYGSNQNQISGPKKFNVETDLD